MRVYFIRHGQSVANIDELEQGPEEPLSEKGKEQAQFVAKRLKDIPITRIIASPHLRTKQTAAVVGEALKLPIEYFDLFVERRPPSDMLGKPGGSPEYMAIRKKWEEERRKDPSWRYKDEETFTEIRERAVSALHYLIAENADHALVVTHAGFMKVLLACMTFGEDVAYATYVDVFNTFRTRNTGVTIADYTVDSNPFLGGWKVIVWNDHAHLP